MLFLELLGATSTVEHYERMAGHVEDLRPAWEQIVERLELGEQRMFETYSGHFVETGELRSSLTHPSASGAIREINGEELVFGSSVEYGVYLPGAAVLGFSDLERRDIDRILLDHITGEAVHAHG